MSEWESGRVGEWESGRVGEWESERQRQTDRHADVRQAEKGSQAGGQRDRQTDKHTYKKR